MVAKGSVDVEQIQGPSGFIQHEGATFLVDYGKISQDGVEVGFLFEDGYFKGGSGPFAQWQDIVPIDEIPGCVFRGIDAAGNALELPGAGTGPSGHLTYNGIEFIVTNGRLSAVNHKLLGGFDDNGKVAVKDPRELNCVRLLDESTQLNTYFQGQKSNGTPMRVDFVRPIPQYRKDRSSAQNEIIRYFMGFDALTTAQKKYVLETMALWAACGLLQVVRKSEGDAAIGNVKHGAAGQTAVRTSNATFDKEEFERDVTYYAKHGAIFNGGTGLNMVEVRLSLVVAHEFGHQVDFTLTKAAQDRITEMYDRRRASCDKLHPPPRKYEGENELLTYPQVESRHFISGYAKASRHEYFAESLAAFSVKDSRQVLKQLDPAMHELLTALVLRPESMLRVVLHDTILALQASLRLGGEFDDDILSL
jgi:hypothetical protein